MKIFFAKFCMLCWIGEILMVPFGDTIITKSLPGQNIAYYDSVADTWATFASDDALDAYDASMKSMVVLSSNNIAISTNNRLRMVRKDGEYMGRFSALNDYQWLSLFSVPQLDLLVAVSVNETYSYDVFFFTEYVPNDNFICSWLDEFNKQNHTYTSSQGSEIILCDHFTFESTLGIPVADITGLTVDEIIPQSTSAGMWPSQSDTHVNMFFLNHWSVNNYTQTYGELFQLNFRNYSNGMPSSMFDSNMTNYQVNGTTMRPQSLYIDLIPMFSVETSDLNNPTQVASARMDSNQVIFLCNTNYGIRKYNTSGAFVQELVDSQGSDIFDCEMSTNGFLYAGDYSGFTAIRVFDPISGTELSELGEEYGSLGSSLFIGFFSGPYAETSRIVNFTEYETVGSSLVFAFELKGADNSTYDVLEYGGSDVDSFGIRLLELTDAIQVNVITQEIVGGITFEASVDVTSLVQPIGDGIYTIEYMPEKASLLAPRFDDDDGGNLTWTYDAHRLGGNKSQAELQELSTTYSNVLEVRVGLTKVLIAQPRFYVSPAQSKNDYSILSPNSFNVIAGQSGSTVIYLKDEYGNQVYNGGEGCIFQFGVTGFEVDVSVYDSNGYETDCSTIIPPGPGPSSIIDYSALPVDGLLRELCDSSTTKNALCYGSPHVLTDDDNSTATDDGSQSQFTVVVEDQGDGSYALSFVSIVAGINVMDVFFQASVIANSPLTAIVIPAEVSGSQCVISGDGATKYTVNEPAYFSVFPRDVYGNLIPYKGESEETLSTFSVMVVPHDLNDVVNVSLVEYSIDGHYEYEYTVFSYAKYHNTDTVSIQVICNSDGSIVGGEPIVAYQQDIYERREVAIGEQAGAYFISCFGALQCLIVTFLVIRYRKENVISFSQPKFLYIILLGLVIGFIAAIVLASSEPNDYKCSMIVSFVNISIIFVITGLLVKTWRIHKIANNKQVAKVRISERVVMQIVASILGVGIILTLLASTVAKPFVDTVEGEVVVNQKTDSTTHYIVDTCDIKHGEYLVAVLLYEIILVLYCVVLAYNTRNVHSAFAENKWIVLSVYNFSVVASLTSALYFLLDLRLTNPGAGLITIVVGIYVSFGGVLYLIFVPKFISIYIGEQVSLDDFLSRQSRSSSLSPLSPTENSKGSYKVRAASRSNMEAGLISKSSSPRGASSYDGAKSIHESEDTPKAMEENPIGKGNLVERFSNVVGISMTNTAFFPAKPGDASPSSEEEGFKTGKTQKHAI